MVTRGCGTTRSGLVRDLALVAALYLFLMGLAVAGSDYGFQWDEKPHKVAVMAGSIKRGILLPDYQYPGVWYDLALASLTPDFLRGAAKHGLVPGDLYGAVLAGQSYLTEQFTRDEFVKSYLIRNRILFAAVSLAALFAVYLMGRWTIGSTAGLAAAAVLAGSFEYFYHAKQFATDAIMASFAAMAGAALCLPGRRFTLTRIYLAAALAGLACGSKYPGGLFALLPLAFAFVALSGYSFRERLRVFLCAFAVFAAVFVATTPGVVLEPGTFVHDIEHQMRHYKVLGHGPNTTTPGLAHAEKIAAYFALSGFSAFAPVAVGLFALAGLGMVRAVRARNRELIAFMILLSLYFAYFASQRVMIVRNLVAALPYLAVFAGVGLAWLFDSIGKRRRAAAWTSALALCACLAANLVFIAATTRQVAAYDKAGLPAQLAAFLDSHPDKTYFVSPSLAPLAGNRTNVTTDRAAKADGLLYSMRDDEGRRLRNKSDLVLAVIGPDDINMNYYNDWIGLDRILVINPKYRRPAVNLADLPGSLPAGTPWDADYCFLFFNDGLTVNLPGPVHAKSLELSLPKGGVYRLEFLAGGTVQAGQTVTPPGRLRGDDDTMATLTVAVPEKAAATGYDRVRIVPAGGPGQDSLGHLRLME